MRCPKCGYISFDNVEKCLKCKKNIAEVSKLFQGSVLNVVTPVFLKLTADEEEMDVAVDEIVETAEEDFEIVDPDLEILMNEDDTADVDLGFDDEEDVVAADDDLADLDELSGELSEIEAFSEEETDLGILEEAVTEELESDLPEMEMPDELADLSDLSPPVKDEFRLDEPEESETTSLDLSDLDEVFGSDSFDEPEPGKEPELKKETVLSLDMDEDLNFELDLGGLSIHDDK